MLDAHLLGHTLWDDMVAKARHARPIGRFLMFRPTVVGQGIGNILQGLLAAHLLGMEFDRVVCIATDWIDFHEAFTPILHQPDCAKLPQQGNVHNLQLLNFLPPPNECRLKQVLASNVEVVYLAGNTYPRWRADIPSGIWERHYRPTPELSRLFPPTFPEMVVHLRAPDDVDVDFRAGLEEKTLEALGRALPNDNRTFLVTNNVDWYSFFETKFGWKHPSWEFVKHSAMLGIGWGADKDKIRYDDDALSHSRQNLELFCDWYILLQAKHIYHTHSDFSLSAIHWNNIDSKTIQGVDNVTGALSLSEEPWRREGAAIPLVNRTKRQLQNCNGAWADVSAALMEQHTNTSMKGDGMDDWDLSEEKDILDAADDNPSREERLAERRKFWGLLNLGTKRQTKHNFLYTLLSIFTGVGRKL